MEHNTEQDLDYSNEGKTLTIIFLTQQSQTTAGSGKSTVGDSFYYSKNT